MADIDRLNALTRRWTAWASFVAMVEAVNDPHYRPSLAGPRGRSQAAREEREALEEIADAYDAEMDYRGDPRRAYRGCPEDLHVPAIIREMQRLRPLID